MKAPSIKAAAQQADQMAAASAPKAPLSVVQGRLLQQFDELLQRKGAPYIGDRRADGVRAKLELNGQEYFSENNWAEGDDAAKEAYAGALAAQHIDEKPPPRAVANHAAGGVVYQALQGGNLGGTARLYLDAEMYGFCDSGAMRGLARRLKLGTLEVFERLPDGQVRSSVIIP